MHGPLTVEEIRTLRRLPPVSRAREHRLYGTDGSRWVDCWVDGGHALEGHRPGGLSHRIKNEVDRGLYAPYPSRWDGRLEKALLKTFPGYAGVRLYRNPEAALAVLPGENSPVDALDLTPGGHAGIIWGRPLLPDHPTAEFLLPVMPVSGLTEVQPVLYRDGPPTADSDAVSPVTLAALIRSLLPGSRAAGIESRGKLPYIDESSDIWDRRGPYLLFRGSETAYRKLFDVMFEKKILIAPSFQRPSIFPAEPNAREALLILSGGEGR